MLPPGTLLWLTIDLVSLRPLLLRTLRGGAAALPALRRGVLLLRTSARAVEFLLDLRFSPGHRVETSGDFRIRWGGRDLLILKGR